ncbi:MAG: twin-arginine translocase TatA/TatE family subunit [Candidatus Kapabacteria bacterium]|nr:twin-arginine translocase TatA/TatE family subunit [Candidatus Kapabacteria bacterium]
MGIPSGMELVIILLVVVLLFGAKKIPELMKGLGSGIREFKNASSGKDEEVPRSKNDSNQDSAN